MLFVIGYILHTSIESNYIQKVFVQLEETILVILRYMLTVKKCKVQCWIAELRSILLPIEMLL